MMSPWFLLIKSPAESDVSAWADEVRRGQGQVMALAGRDSVKPLEIGSAHDGLLIARFASAGQLDTCWERFAGAVSATPGVVALGARGGPYEGWRGDPAPARAAVDTPDGAKAPAYMVIEGTVADRDQLGRYVQVIRPMLRERGAYYLVSERGLDVRVLAGRWSEEMLAVSCWPSWGAAEEFWYSQRYQTVAMPLRAGHGRFDVQLAPGVVPLS